MLNFYLLDSLFYLIGAMSTRRSSPQTEALKNFIATAKDGNEASIRFLRECLEIAAKKAPTKALILLSECLLYIGTDAELSLEEPT